MEEAINETNRRRQIQLEYNAKHGITPTTIVKAIQDIISREKTDKQENQREDINLLKASYNLLIAADRKKYIKELEKEMFERAKNLEFEQAAILRDEIESIKNMQIS
jgi:excinuclease ABC subunit B